VFGAHYDFALNEIGHPVFQGQMRSFAEFGAHIREHYGINDPVEDVVRGVLNRVRVPTAQMDVFSLVIQICADHLLYKEAGPEETDAFKALLRKSKFCKGAGFQVPSLTSDDARTCYRARHWYPE
jgi:hypothetical protein